MFKTILMCFVFAFLAQPVTQHILDLADQTYQFAQHEVRQVDALGKSFDAGLDELANVPHTAWMGQAYLFGIDTRFANELDEGALSDSLRAVFRSQGRTLTDKAKTMVEEAGSKWTIIDGDADYLMEYEEQKLNVYGQAKICEISEGEKIAAKLIVIAADRKERPAIYSELEDTYLNTVDNPMSRARTSPPLRSIHLSETYRLAWEYLLLRPRPMNAASHYEVRVTQALSKIGNTDSLVALTHSYRITTHKNVVLTRYVSQRQRLLLSTLGQMPGQAALDAILQCLEMSATQKQHANIVDTQWDPEEYAFRLLTDQVNYGLGEDWRRVVLQAPTEGLSAHEVAFLNRVKQY